jgi:hypothetical protein
MTDEQSGSSTVLYVRKRLAAHRKRQEQDRKRQEQECIRILARAYIDVLAELNGNASEAFQLFDKFARTAAKAPVPRKGRGKADLALDARILAAGDAAPRRQREAVVAAAAGARTVREIDAARKRYNRLRAEKDAYEKGLAEVVAAVSRKWRWPRQHLFKSTVPAPLEGLSEGDKCPP